MTSRLGPGKSLSFFYRVCARGYNLWCTDLVWHEEVVSAGDVFHNVSLYKIKGRSLIQVLKNQVGGGDAAIETTRDPTKNCFHLEKSSITTELKLRWYFLCSENRRKQQLSHCSKYFICLLFLFLFILNRLPHLSQWSNGPPIFEEYLEILQ